MWYQIFSCFTENPSNFTGDESAFLLFGALALAFLLYILLVHGRKRNSPPGPLGVPIFGYYPFLLKNPHRKLCELGKKYGNIIGLYLGPQYVVVLNDWDAVKDALSQDATIDRPPFLFEGVPYNFGMSGTSGAEWNETRRLSSRALKDSLQKNHWEDLVEEEVSETVKRILQKGGNPIEVRSFFRETFAINSAALLLGERLQAVNPVTELVSKGGDDILQYIPTVAMRNFSPLLGKFFHILGIEEQYPLAKKLQEFGRFVSKTVDEKLEKSNSMMEDSFIERFYEEIENQRKCTEKTYITEENLKGTVMGLLAGGSETTRTSLIWTLVAMAEHPGIQQKVQEELDKVAGSDVSIRWSDRTKVPYTYATLLESMRWRSTVYFPSMRIVSEDTKVQGYTIPKGTYVLTNIWAIHNDPRYWPIPELFIPERFLLEDGKKVNAARDSFNAFSYGKRQCPGKLLAYMECLQYFTTLMRKFKIIPKEGTRVKYDEVFGLSHQARNVELRFIPR